MVAGVRPRGPVWQLAAGATVAALVAGGWVAWSHLRAHVVVGVSAPVAAPAPAVAPAPAPVAAPLPVAPPPTPMPPIEAPPSARVPALPPAAHAAPARRAAPHVAAEAHRPPAVVAPDLEPPVEDALAREAALVEEARGVVRSRPAVALAALERHRREFPAGQLTAEREFLTVYALIQLGRHAEAESRGRRLVEQFPHSAYAQQVPALLGK
jgi:hypothetical protein